MTAESMLANLNRCQTNRNKDLNICLQESQHLSSCLGSTKHGRISAAAAVVLKTPGRKKPWPEVLAEEARLVAAKVLAEDERQLRNVPASDCVLRPPPLSAHSRGRP